MTQDEKSIQSLIDTRIREMLGDMGDSTAREKEALAGAVERMLRAKPLAGDHGLDLLSLLQEADKGPQPQDK